MSKKDITCIVAQNNRDGTIVVLAKYDDVITGRTEATKLAKDTGAPVALYALLGVAVPRQEIAWIEESTE